MFAGARTIVAHEIIPAAVLELIESTRATHAFFITAVLGMLLNDLERARTAVATLQLVGYRGSPMPAAMMRKTPRHHADPSTRCTARRRCPG
jgi:non-ribosomal peptide synthetase component E (peptide arylation enzyme)